MENICFKVLSFEETQEIHDYSVKVLKEIGVKIDNKELINEITKELLPIKK